MSILRRYNGSGSGKCGLLQTWRAFIADSDGLEAYYGKVSFYGHQGVLNLGFPITARLLRGFWT